MVVVVGSWVHPPVDLDPPVLGLADLVVELLRMVVDLMVGLVVILMVMGIPQGCNPPVRDHRLHCRQQMLTLQGLHLPVVH